MGAIDGPVQEIGHKVGAALVGTFLGILLSYGFFAPLACKIELMGWEKLTFFRTVGAIIGDSLLYWLSRGVLRRTMSARLERVYRNERASR